jgi:hypothetical protein
MIHLSNATARFRHRPPIRGYPSRYTNLMEQLQVGDIKAGIA